MNDDDVNAVHPMCDAVDVYHEYDFHDVLQVVQHVPINFHLKLLYRYQDPVDLYIHSSLKLLLNVLDNH